MEPGGARREHEDSTGRPVGHRGLVDLLGKVEADLVARRTSGALDDALRRWQTRREELRAFEDVSSLIAFLRDPDAERRWAKDSALAALCIEGIGGEDDAALLLVWLMLPGLLLVRRRLTARGGISRGDLDAELLAGVWESATEIGPATSNVAARLLDRARRRALAAIRQEEQWAGRTEPLTRDVEELAGPQADAGDVLDVLAEAVRARVISSGEADLFRTSRTTIRELRSRLGVSESGVRSRRLRVKRRLLVWLASSSAIPLRSRIPGSSQELPTDTPTCSGTEEPPRPHL